MTRTLAKSPALGRKRQSSRHVLLASMSGIVFALLVYQLWTLQGRWFAVAVVALLGVFTTLFFVYRLLDFFLIILFFSAPFATFTKWINTFGYDGNLLGSTVYTGTLSLGLTDFILAGIYLAWFVHVFLLRTVPLPGFLPFDKWVLALIAIYALAIPGSLNPTLGVYSLIHLIKHALIYFFVSRNFQHKHIVWLMASLCFAVVLDFSLAAVQYKTGMLAGLALDKGALDGLHSQQYIVPGMDDSETRATGTSLDSHALGSYMAQISAFLLVLLLAPGRQWPYKKVTALVWALCVSTMVLSLSRSAWLSFLLSTAFLLWVVFRMRERHTHRFFMLLFAGVVAVVPWLAPVVIERFTNAPIELLTSRFDMWVIALDIWRDHLPLGVGPSNYSLHLVDYSRDFLEETLVHNVTILIGVETGILGLIAFYSMHFAAMSSSWSLFKSGNTLGCRLGLALFTVFLVFLLDGMTNPLFKEPIVYFNYWMYLGLVVALLKSSATGHRAT